MTTSQPIIGLDPTGTTTITEPLAARPDELRGAVLGLVSNRKGVATALLHALADEMNVLGAGLAGTVLIEKASVFAAPAPDDWNRLTAGATIAITGYGG